MKAISEYRAAARETLDGRWNSAAVMVLIITLLVILFTSLSVYIALAGSLGYAIPERLSLPADGVNTVFSLLVTGPLEMAMLCVLLMMKRNNLEDTPLASMFQSFKSNWSRFVVAQVLETIIIVLISIPTLCIGGIIFSYAYRMVPYLLHDYPDLTPKEALKLSRQMMRGYKANLFLLDFSFIGWGFLCILSCGIGLLWLIPYMYTASAHFYEDVKDETLEDDNTPAEN